MMSDQSNYTLIELLNYKSDQGIDRLDRRSMQVLCISIVVTSHVMVKNWKGSMMEKKILKLYFLLNENISCGIKMTYNKELKAKNTILPNLHIYWLFSLSPLLSFSLQNILYTDGIFRRGGGGRIHWRGCGNLSRERGFTRRLVGLAVSFHLMWPRRKPMWPFILSKGQQLFHSPGARVWSTTQS